MVPVAFKTLPPEMKIKALFDQSLFVRASIQGVLREGLIAAGSYRRHDPDLPWRLASDD